jgi:hypothetical protein
VLWAFVVEDDTRTPTNYFVSGKGGRFNLRFYSYSSVVTHIAVSTSRCSVRTASQLGITGEHCCALGEGVIAGVTCIATWYQLARAVVFGSSATTAPQIPTKRCFLSSTFPVSHTEDCSRNLVILYDRTCISAF